MLTYCLKCKKDTESVDLKIKNGRLMLLWKCDVCGSKKSKFIKEQEAKGLFIKGPLSKVSLLGDILF